jgi:hypothetical protein
MDPFWANDVNCLWLGICRFLWELQGLFCVDGTHVYHLGLIGVDQLQGHALSFLIKHHMIGVVMVRFPTTKSTTKIIVELKYYIKEPNFGSRLR